MAADPIHICENAFSAGGQLIRRDCIDFGVYAPDGRLLPHGRVVSFSWHCDPPERRRRRTPAGLKLGGTVLLAGGHEGRFGHDLLSSLGRLWALDTLGPQTTILFAFRYPRVTLQPALIRALGYDNPIIAGVPQADFERLATAEDRFGAALGGRGTAEFHAWIDSRWPAEGPPDPGRKLYVTRLGLGPRTGRFACEDLLASHLASAGYEIFHPERHDIRDQVRAYQSASRLIFAESSALHLFLLVRRPEQIAAVIQRRPQLPDVMIAQMSDRPGPPVQAIEAIRETWWLPIRADNMSLAVLDFARLRAALTAGGFLSPRSAWRDPTADEVKQSLHAALQQGESLMTLEQRDQWLRARRREAAAKRAGQQGQTAP